MCNFYRKTEFSCDQFRSFMQNLHAGFAAPNTVILEVAPAYGPLHSKVIGDSCVMADGEALPPTRPGLGIELTEETKKNFPFVPGSGEFNSVPGKSLEEESANTSRG